MGGALYFELKEGIGKHLQHHYHTLPQKSTYTLNYSRHEQKVSVPSSLNTWLMEQAFSFYFNSVWEKMEQNAKELLKTKH